MINATATHRWFLIPLVVVGALTTSCDEGGNPIIGPSTLVIITLRNQDAGPLPTHLFGDLIETFPCCQVAPGGSREAPIEVPPNRDVTLVAGRNQAVLPGGNFSTKITQAEFDAKAATFTWLGNGWTK